MFIQKLLHTYSRFTMVEYANPASSETKRDEEKRSVIWANYYLIVSQFQNVSDVWTLPLLPENLMDIFPEQRQERTFEINVNSECVVSDFIYCYIF